MPSKPVVSVWEVVLLPSDHKYETAPAGAVRVILLPSQIGAGLAGLMLPLRVLGCMVTLRVKLAVQPYKLLVVAVTV